MTLFDLLFIAVFVAVIVLVVLAALAALRGRRERAFALLRALALLAGTYLGVVVVVSLLSPHRVLNLGDEQCWDDWCIAVTNVRREPATNGLLYEVMLRISSRARRSAQRERGVQVYLMDDHGRCYDPEFDADAVPFDALLQPQEAFNIQRTFRLPADAFNPVLVVSHASFSPALFVIGDPESLFHKRTVVRLE